MSQIRWWNLIGCSRTSLSFLSFHKLPASQSLSLYPIFFSFSFYYFFITQSRPSFFCSFPISLPCNRSCSRSDPSHPTRALHLELCSILLPSKLLVFQFLFFTCFLVSWDDMEVPFYCRPLQREHFGSLVPSYPTQAPGGQQCRLQTYARSQPRLDFIGA